MVVQCTLKCVLTSSCPVCLEGVIIKSSATFLYSQKSFGMILSRWVGWFLWCDLIGTEWHELLDFPLGIYRFIVLFTLIILWVYTGLFEFSESWKCLHTLEKVIEGFLYCNVAIVQCALCLTYLLVHTRWRSCEVFLSIGMSLCLSLCSFFFYLSLCWQSSYPFFLVHIFHFFFLMGERRVGSWCCVHFLLASTHKLTHVRWCGINMIKNFFFTGHLT